MQIRINEDSAEDILTMQGLRELKARPEVKSVAFLFADGCLCTAHRHEGVPQTGGGKGKTPRQAVEECLAKLAECGLWSGETISVLSYRAGNARRRADDERPAREPRLPPGTFTTGDYLREFVGAAPNGTTAIDQAECYARLSQSGYVVPLAVSPELRDRVSGQAVWVLLPGGLRAECGVHGHGAVPAKVRVNEGWLAADINKELESFTANCKAPEGDWAAFGAMGPLSAEGEMPATPPLSNPETHEEYLRRRKGELLSAAEIMSPALSGADVEHLKEMIHAHIKANRMENVERSVENMTLRGR